MSDARTRAQEALVERLKALSPRVLVWTSVDAHARHLTIAQVDVTLTEGCASAYALGVDASDALDTLLIMLRLGADGSELTADVDALRAELNAARKASIEVGARFGRMRDAMAEYFAAHTAFCEALVARESAADKVLGDMAVREARNRQTAARELVRYEDARELALATPASSPSLSRSP